MIVAGRLWENSFEEIYAGAIDPLNPPLALFQKVYDGAVIAAGYADTLLSQAIRRYGPGQPVGYPDMGYCLPVILSLSGEKVTRLGELVPVLNLIRNRISEVLDFEHARRCGEATAYAAEIIEVLRCLDADKAHVKPQTGFVGDPLVRRYGINLADRTIPGQAVLTGRARCTEDLAGIVSDLQSKGFMIFMAGEVAEQAAAAGLKLGVDYITFTLGSFTQVIHALNYSLRAGLVFGGIAPGMPAVQRDYQYRSIRAFVLHFGERDAVYVATHFAAIFLGFPVLVDQALPAGEQIPNWYISNPDYDSLVRVALEVRGIRLKNQDIPVPFSVSPAYEGEAVRNKDMYLEFGGARTPSFELVKMVGADGIEDGKTEVIGSDVDEIEEGTALSGGIYVKVYGRKMREEFEDVLERRIHEYVNCGEGLWHAGQRNACRYRVSKDCVARGFKFRHYGDLLISKFKDDFPALVDRVQVTVYTEPQAVAQKLEEAREVYARREARLACLTDETVDLFYSCKRCQSYAPNHLCIITPERPGLCGTVSWLDGKVSYENDPTGPCQPIKKEVPIDVQKGIWQSVNDFVYNNSNRNIEKCAIYSFIDHPMTSCGCFECIMGIVPEANGVMVTTREYGGMTPCGMDISTLAGTVGGGTQTPGFMGHGRTYLLSGKFIKADGGLARLVWMPKALKDWFGDDLRRAAAAQGLGAGFVEKIADETVGTTVEEILPFLAQQDHPALAMEPLL